MKLYEALAADFEESIRKGVLRAGDKLPSVRQTSRSRKVSASTVFQAYYLLEGRGLIRARERAGYFVAPSVRASMSQPARPSAPRDESVSVGVSALVADILASVRTRSVAQFGSAFPSPELFPFARLGRSLASTARFADPWSSMDDLSPGNAVLRRQISLRYLADGVSVAPDEIVITNGALEALGLCLSAVTQPGDTVIVECPAFYAALQMIERMGLRAVPIRTHPTKGIDLTALEHAIIRHSPKVCWFMTTFQNPLGCTMSEVRKKELVALLARHQIPMIEDDVYAELYFGDVRPAPAKAFDKKGLVMHCSSFSKSLAPGYRIGWAAPGRFAAAVAREKIAVSLSACVPAQLALADYLKHASFDKHLRRLRQTLASRQSTLVRALAHYFPSGTLATQPKGGYFLWVEVPGELDVLDIQRQAMAIGVSFAPGPMFSAAGEFRNCLRLNYGHPWDVHAERSIETLGKMLLKAMRSDTARVAVPA